MKRFWILITLCASLLLQACVTENPYNDGSEQLPTAPSTTKESDVTDIQPSSPYRSPLAIELEQYLSTNDPFYQKVMNKTVNEFGDALYVPPNLTNLNADIVPMGRTIQLEPRTAYAIRAMLAEMEYDGIHGVMVTSGYRSIERQSTLFNTYLQKEMSGFTADAYACLGAGYIEDKYDLETDIGLDSLDAERVVLSYAAPAGMSEHQTGLCVDLILASMTELTNDFESTSAFSWLTKNAHRFGFILRYPKDKTEQTGYAYESWHYRYVGRDVAAKILANGQTLEQYRAIAE